MLNLSSNVKAYKPKTIVVGEVRGIRVSNKGNIFIFEKKEQDDKGKIFYVQVGAAYLHDIYFNIEKED